MTVKMGLAVSSAVLLSWALSACTADPLPVGPSGARRSAPPAPHARRGASERIASAIRPSRPFRAEMTRKGVTVLPSRGSAWAFQATPRGFGCEGALVELGDATPAVIGGRVEYERRALREWYVDGPRGLEQGFTIPSPPPCRGRGRHGLMIALGGGLSAAVSQGGRAALLRDASGAEVLRYTDLHVVDASGRELPARIEAREPGLAIRFDDTGARYPVEVDPVMWAQQTELTPSDASVERFGQAVAVSGDTIVVGAPATDGDGLPGEADVFVRSATTWTMQQRLSPNGLPGDSEFGYSVALSGGTALIGAPLSNHDNGDAYVFVRSGASWIQQQVLSGSAAPEVDAFGTSVALNGDTALVGASTATLGAVFVYVLSGTTWIPQQVLTDDTLVGGATSNVLGTSVALDGDTAILGARGVNDDAQGAAYVVVRSGTTWTLQQKLVAGDGTPNDEFGTSVAIAGDTAIVGAPAHASGAGALYVFNRSGATWTQAQELSADPPVSGFGAGVALRDGAALAVGTAGSVYLYTPSAAGLTFLQLLTPDRPVAGTAVALSGTTAVAGAPQIGQGEAFVLTFGSPTGSACTSPDACFSGYCVDGVCCDTSACAAAGPCNGAETCQAGTGTCSVTPINEGMACDVGNACNSSATCNRGVCTGEVQVCAPADACHDFGACDPTSGTCTNPVKPDGQPCPGGTCAAGLCIVPPGEDGGQSDAGVPAGSTAAACQCDTSRSPSSGTLAVALGLLLLGRRRPRHRRPRLHATWRSAGRGQGDRGRT